MGKRDFFSEEEAAEILRRASQLQDAAGLVKSPNGVTMADLQRIAQEAGIDPRFVTQAASKPVVVKRPRPFGLGNEYEFVINRELSHEEILSVLEEFTVEGKVQTMQSTRRTLKAQIYHGIMSGYLEVTAREGRTTILFRTTALIPYFAGAHTPVLLAFILGPILSATLRGANGPILGIAVGFGMLLLAWFLFRMMMNAGVGKADRLWETVLPRLATVADAPAPVDAVDPATTILPGLTPPHTDSSLPANNPLQQNG